MTTLYGRAIIGQLALLCVTIIIVGVSVTYATASKKTCCFISSTPPPSVISSRALHHAFNRGSIFSGIVCHPQGISTAYRQLLLVRRSRILRLTAAAGQPQKEQESGPGSSEKGQGELYTFDDLTRYCERYGVRLEESNLLGMLMRIVALRIEDGRELGSCEAAIRGNVLQLDTLRMASVNVKMNTSDGLFQLGGVLSAYAVRKAYDRGCKRAELLAIRDSERIEKKLVRAYRFAGFKEMRKIEDTLASMPDRLVWGGVGTLMACDIDSYMSKWSPILTASPKD